MKQEKKYHHYIPQFYLRNFSSNNKSVGMYLFQQDKYIHDAPIDNVGGQDYLYGKNPKIEDWFSSLEQYWAVIIKNIIISKKLPDRTSEDYALLLMMMYLSEVRTAYMADYQNEILRVTAYEFYEILKNSSSENLPSSFNPQDISLDIPNLPLIQDAGFGVEIISDLKMVILENQTSYGFITTDVPVVRYNQFFMTRGYPRNFGLGQVGSQCFFPISPSICLVLYDETVYKTPTLTRDDISIVKTNQVGEINRLMTLGAYQRLFFDNKTPDWKIRQLAKKKNTRRCKQPTIWADSNGSFLTSVSYSSIFEKIKLPMFIISDVFMDVLLPSNMAGPLRPPVEKIIDKRKSSNK